MEITIHSCREIRRPVRADRDQQHAILLSEVQPKKPLVVGGVGFPHWFLHASIFGATRMWTNSSSRIPVGEGSAAISNKSETALHGPRSGASEIIQ
jgi:hypothetical protein